MGATGPCGTCTEIHVALTDELCSSSHLVNTGNPLLTELWNIVFIRYDRRVSGNKIELEKIGLIYCYRTHFTEKKMVR